MKRLLRTIVSAPAVHWRVLLLALVTALVWCAHYDRWTLASWSIPIEYRGDAPETLAQMRAAADGDILPLTPKVIERLGAPFGAEWSAYPIPEKPWLLLAGALTHGIGLFAAANLVMLLGAIASALAFYFVARWLRCRWEWAWAGALLYAFTYYTFHRGLAHFSVALTWTVPLGLLAVWLVARSRRLEWRSGGAVVCLGSALALGVGNPYNLLFWLQLMGWAIIAHWFDGRRRANLAIGIAAMALAGAAFVLSHIEVWIFAQEPSGAPLVSRNYAGTEFFALKPMELFVPSKFHRWDAFAFLGHRYERWSSWRGEPFLPYVGLVGIAGILWLSLLTARRIFRRQSLPGQSLSIGWLLAYSSIGGVTNVLALVAGFQVFRATNRVAIFISTIILVFLMVRLSRATRGWPRWSRIALAIGIAAIGVIDQVPRAESRSVRARIAAAVRSDLEFGRSLEANLPPGAMIFQLPVIGFPEVLTPHELADYELFRPYLATTNLRFSYGATKDRARSQWQSELEGAPAATLVHELEALGFSALYLNKRGFKDRADGLLAELGGLGYDRRIQSQGGHQVAVLLNPVADPSLPLGQKLTPGQGWHRRVVDGVRWAYRDAVFSYFNPYSQPITADIEIILEGVTGREVWIARKGRELGRVHAGEEPVTLRLPDVELSPGVNVFRLRSNQPAIRIGHGPYRLRTFGLHDTSVRPAWSRQEGSRPGSRNRKWGGRSRCRSAVTGRVRPPPANSGTGIWRLFAIELNCSD